MNYLIWLKRLIRLAGIVACIYFAGLLFFGPPYLAREHLFTWDLNFQHNVDLLAATVSSEEELIVALQKRGFEIWMRPENPVTNKDNGLHSISYKDDKRSYTTYAEFVQMHDRFQAALPKDHREMPRVATWTAGFFACAHDYSVIWHLRDGEIVDLKANDSWACL